MKRQGHYCKVCGEYKANEKFTGRGHAAHICKACAKLSSHFQDRVDMAKSLFGVLPQDMTPEQAREERLDRI